jgi:hypothetical protein
MRRFVGQPDGMSPIPRKTNPPDTTTFGKPADPPRSPATPSPAPQPVAVGPRCVSVQVAREARAGAGGHLFGRLVQVGLVDDAGAGVAPQPAVKSVGDF